MSTRSADSLTLALAAMGDPEDRTANSGWPTGVLSALREIVAQVVPIRDSPYSGTARLAFTAGAILGVRPSDLRHPREAKGRLWNVGKASLPYALARARTVRGELANAGSLDGFVQNGGDYPAPRGVRMVTYQDSTVAQALDAYPWPHLLGLTRRDIRGMVRRQRDAYESAIGCCTFTQWNADSIASDFGIPRSKIHVVGLGTNGSFPESDTQERDWATPRFLFVGFDWVRKNGDLVLEAFARIRESVPAATLDLVGRHPTVDLAGVTGHGVLAMDDPEQRARLTSLYQQATAFVMPSLHEPAGTVYVEAAAAGIPAIGTRNGGSATCIGPAGYVVDPASPVELFDAMHRLCDPATAASCGALGREHAKQFTWRKVAERLVRALSIPNVDLTGFAEFL
jgi:glycosyltransferase involved in cell wall biosynthesis